jgi:predicted enzyme related to lactoylglutathione lyase
MYEGGIPATAFMTSDIQAEYERLKGLGVTFITAPLETEYGWHAVFDDTCGNLIMLHGE